MNRLLPIFLKLQGESCLVVGGGKVALQKVEQLENAGAIITLVAPRLATSFNSKKFKHVPLPYEAKYLTGKKIVIAATDDLQVNRKIYWDAHKLNIPVNVVDEPELCSFYMGSVYSDGDLKIAVSTNGSCPSFGKYVRDHIKSISKGLWGNSLKKLALHREKIIHTIGSYSQKKQIMSQLVKDQEVIQSSRKKSGGKVYLVGTGPGDPELITIKGYHAILNADVIVHDALVHPHLVFEINPIAEKIYVGKRKNKHSVEQSAIHSILIEEVSKGRQVVRLKGGDPFIFGRGGEEAAALAEKNIAFEVIAGITAGLGAAAGYGIPLTYREEATKILFITGHQCDKNSKHDWKQLAALDATLVFYMGIKRISDILRGLISQGKPVDTPIAIIENATLVDQKIIISKLGDMKKEFLNYSIGTPAIIIIGEVVDHYKNIQHCVESFPAGIVRDLDVEGFNLWRGEYIKA